jgi:hypothetical protein
MTISITTFCRYAKCGVLLTNYFAECHFSECRYAECRGAWENDQTDGRTLVMRLLTDQPFTDSATHRQ